MTQFKVLWNTPCLLIIERNWNDEKTVKNSRSPVLVKLYWNWWNAVFWKMPYQKHSQPTRQFAILCEKMIYELPLIDSLKNVSNCSQKYVKLFTLLTLLTYRQVQRSSRCSNKWLLFFRKVAWKLFLYTKKDGLLMCKDVWFLSTNLCWYITILPAFWLLWLL